jgi:hypothetical protein
MTKDEYISILNTNIAINSIVSGFSEKASGKMEGLQKAVELAKELDKPKTVTIPQFVANDIEGHKKGGSDLREALCDGFDWGIESNVYWWFICADDGDRNVRKYISAWKDGYEIGEPKYRVPLPNLNSDNGKQFITYKNDKWFACAYRNNLQQEFTELELANLPKPYCDYERVEVKDND